MSTRHELEQTIKILEAQRADLGDPVVNAVLTPLRQKLASLKAAEPMAETAAEKTLYCHQNNSWSVIAHELGHTLTFIHEHQRPDRDKFIIVNSEVAKKDPYHILPVVPGKDMTFGDYDCVSINHYPPDSAISFRPDGFATIGSTTGVSLGDMAAVRAAISMSNLLIRMTLW